MSRQSTNVRIHGISSISAKHDIVYGHKSTAEAKKMDGDNSAVVHEFDLDLPQP